MKKTSEKKVLSTPLGKLLDTVSNIGFHGAYYKVKAYTARRWTARYNFENFTPSLEALEKQSKEVFSHPVLFSVVVPLYNTPEIFLREMIESVKAQSYVHWQLCLADGSDEAHAYVEEIVRSYAQKDDRILYQHLEKNGGISENTNACIQMATGDYIALFDHDDLLVPCALYEYAKVIAACDADFLYCDEDKFETVGSYFDPYFKPDFAADNLRANNYICHFTVFKSSLLDKVGMFRPAFDGSQDHDMVLRLTEQAKNIVHIPKILYHWRVSSASVASDPYAKPYTICAGRNAVTEHLQRCGLEGSVESSVVHPNIYRIKYPIQGCPLISIVIAKETGGDTLSRCVRSIQEKTTYQNYEILVVEMKDSKDKPWEKENSGDKRPVSTLSCPSPHISAQYNEGAKHAKGEYLVFLHESTLVMSAQWLEEMLGMTQREDVGAVGGKLYAPNRTIRHCGVILGGKDAISFAHENLPGNSPGYFGMCCQQQNFSAVSAACMMVKKSTFEEIGGFDEAFAHRFYDVDLCLRMGKNGQKICLTPYAEMITGAFRKTRGKWKKDEEIFRKRYEKELQKGDPFYNSNLSLRHSDYSIKRSGERNF